MRQELPIERSRTAIIDAVRGHQVVIVAGETGSGKTTKVPQYLLEEGFAEHGLIGITEPRRIAAVSVATYVSSCFGLEVGELVGYQIRHENRTGEATLIKYMTDGILLRELLGDPDLARYAAIVIDEVHERNVNQDLVMALIKDLLPRRPDLKVVIMSATIEEARFARYFSAPVVHIEGRTFPVDVIYRGGEGSVDEAVSETVSLLARTDGDILVFVPDYDSIRVAMQELPRRKIAASVLPLYGNQSPEEQMRVFDRKGRTVIVATNIAETSVTLDGVTAVVDTGQIKEMRYFPSSSISALRVVRHSRAGCDQRAGRAGRTAPGVCVRLYDRADYHRRLRYTEPEIRRVSLDQVLLQMKAMGLTDARIRTFDFLDAPTEAAWDDAAECLWYLGAIDDEGDLTDDGTFMSQMPLPPIVSRMVLSAERYGCIEPVTTIAASFSTRPVFTRPPGKEVEADEAHRRFRDSRSDFLTLLNVVRAWRNVAEAGRPSFLERYYLHGKALEEIEDVSTQIRAILEERGITISNGASPEDIGRAVTSGLIANLLVTVNGKAYSHRKHEGIFIHPGSSVNGHAGPTYAVAAEIVETTRKFARGVQSVKRQWLEDIVGDVDQWLPRRLKRKRRRR